MHVRSNYDNPGPVRVDQKLETETWFHHQRQGVYSLPFFFGFFSFFLLKNLTLWLPALFRIFVKFKITALETESHRSVKSMVVWVPHTCSSAAPCACWPHPLSLAGAATGIMCVATNVLLWQTCVCHDERICHDKTHLLSWQKYACGAKPLSRQKYACCAKLCCDKIFLSWQTCVYVWFWGVGGGGCMQNCV